MEVWQLLGLELGRVGSMAKLLSTTLGGLLKQAAGTGTRREEGIWP